jgi:hypothetical protein
MSYREIEAVEAVGQSNSKQVNQWAIYEKYRLEIDEINASLESEEEIKKNVKKMSIYEIVDEATDKSIKIIRDDRGIKLKASQHQQDVNKQAQDDKQKYYKVIVVSTGVFGALSAAAGLAGVAPVAGVVAKTFGGISATGLAGVSTAVSQVTKTTGDQITTGENSKVDTRTHDGQQADRIGDSYKQGKDDGARQYHEHVQGMMKIKDVFNDLVKGMFGGN